MRHVLFERPLNVTLSQTSRSESVLCRAVHVLFFLNWYFVCFLSSYPTFFRSTPFRFHLVIINTFFFHVVSARKNCLRGKLMSHGICPNTWGFYVWNNDQRALFSLSLSWKCGKDWHSQILIMRIRWIRIHFHYLLELRAFVLFLRVQRRLRA